MEKLGGLKHLLVTVFLSILASFMAIPAITDVTMSALCPGKDECSLAIYLTGFQQMIIGLGTMVMMPLIGNLSDQYGRKALLTFPMTLSIIPLVILAYSRTTNFFYLYFVLRTLTAMVSEGSINCLALAYVADNISDGGRASAFGILSGVGSAAFVCGTLAARFLSTAQTFQGAAILSMAATVYMRVFLKDTIVLHDDENSVDDLRQPILKSNGTDIIISDPNRKIQVFKKIPSLGDLICLFKSSKTFSQAIIVVFFNSLAESAVQASLLYFLKARFHFNKNQFADLMLIAGVSGTVSQLFLMPILAPAIGEEKLLSIGLLAGCTNMFIYSISWSVWVPYAASSVFNVLLFFAPPCIRSIASKQVGSNEQGKAQGCISGISSFASIISPLIFSPLTAMFLSEESPFHFPGFSIMCIGLASLLQSTKEREVSPLSIIKIALKNQTSHLLALIAFIQSIMIRPVSPLSSDKVSKNNSIEA